jgi:hypothetical protein
VYQIVDAEIITGCTKSEAVLHAMHITGAKAESTIYQALADIEAYSPKENNLSKLFFSEDLVQLSVPEGGFQVKQRK